MTVNGFDLAQRPSWRQERRTDRQAEREADRADRREAAEQRRLDEQAAQQRRLEARDHKAAKRADRAERRREARRARWVAVRGAVTEHVPVAALPVVAVSLAFGWGGQAQSAVVMGMGAFAAGMPVLTEGMTLTLAGLTAQAISERRPYRGLFAATWAAGLFAAGVNAAGHLIEDAGAQGVFRAVGFTVASLAALILWTVVMMAKRTAASGRTAQEVARWRRLRRRHPILFRRARHIADATGVSETDAFNRVWEGRHGAPPSEATIPEIRARRRAAHRRAVAESWNGNRRWGRRSATPAHVLAADAETPPEVVSAGDEETVPTVSEPQPPAEPGPVLPGGLLIPAADGTWTRHTVRVQPQAASPTVSVAGQPPSGTHDTDTNAAREEDPRLETVRALVTEAIDAGADLTRKPSLRKTAARVGCRPTTARRLLTTVLAEHGVTR